MSSVNEVPSDDSETVEISVREITNQEKQIFIKNKLETSCHGSNTHLLRLEQDVPDVCSLFSFLNVTAVALGGEHALVLTAQKQLFSEGSNDYGQLGLGDRSKRSGLSLVQQFTDIGVKHMSCGARHNAIVCYDGTLLCWGDSRAGQCGLGAKGVFTTPTKVNFPPLCKASLTVDQASKNKLSTCIREVSCAELFTITIDSRGILWSWGKGLGMGHGNKLEECIVPTLVRGLRNKKAVKVVCGSFHSVVVTQDDDEDTQFNIQSPDYRTASISSTYYSELQNRRSADTSRVPFLQSTFFSCGEDSQMYRSHSDTELDSHGAAYSKKEEKAVSTSEIDLRHVKEKSPKNAFLLENLTYHKQTSKTFVHSDESSSSSADVPSMVSSQYYSAVDMGLSPEGNVSSINDETSTPKVPDSVNTADSTKFCTPELSLINNDDNINETTFSISQAENNNTSDVSLNDGTDGLFLGKKSLFGQNNQDNDSLVTLHSFNLTDDVIASDPSLGRLKSEDDTNLGCLETVLSTEVWSWGENAYGQLGHGDVMERLEPMVIKKLSGKQIVYIAAGSYHTLAVNIHGQVYGWGDNTFGQLAQKKTVIPTPKKVKVLAESRVWDVAAGRNFSLFLGDVERKKTEVFFSGEITSQKVERSVSDPIIKIAADKKKSEGRWRLSRRSKRSPDGSSAPNFIDIQLRKLTHFDKNEVVKCLASNDFSFACITERFGSGSTLEPIYKFARGERLFQQQLTVIQKAVIEPLIQTDAWLSITKLPGGEAMIPLIDSFVDLLNGINTELAHLTEVVRHSLRSQELFSYLFSDSFRGVYDRYSQCYCDAVAVGHMMACNKQASSIISKLKDVMSDLEKNLSLSQATFESLLKAPLMRSHVYCDIAKRISGHCQSKTESEHLKEVITRWLQFSDVNMKRMVLAASTSKYWHECHAKISEALKDPQRRVLKSSKYDPLSLSRASRLSSHSYILCNDVFVHVQFTRTFQVFPLVTLWADSDSDTDHTQNAIKITTPEESFVLSAGTPAGKVVWLTELNQAIASCLSACSSHSLDVGSVNASSGLLKAAVAREASYTYVNHPIFKTASYKGMWMAGVPHGRGKMSWIDGSCYEGEFVKGQFHGYGQMFWPKNSTVTYEKTYDGEWFEGHMCGHGTMRYGQGDEYVGNFRDDMRHGHGTLKSSQNKTSLDTIYIGDWANDMKSGYGVLDYIVRGEKYMGMWSNDQRQGYGVVVTVDGVYYEGKFFQNRLAGKGILLSEDDTCYEGEFTADMLLSGKGILTLPNGDYIDGTFYGNWGESIKVNGVFSKFINPMVHDNSDNSRGNQLGTTDFTIDADAKWKSLFEECLAVLGCGDELEIEAEQAWKNVTNAVLKAAGSMRSRRVSTRFDMDFVRKTNFKDHIQLANNLKALQEYLSQAFDTAGHPLNVLVEGLVDVYRATYVGVGAHRRLLPHAVAEAKSYVTRLFNVLRVLFPDLHDEEFVLLSNETVDGVVETPINSMSLLHPLLLPRLYPPLFTLYALLTEKTDAIYTEKLYYLNKRGDIALLSFLGVKRTFWLLPDDQLSSTELVASHEKRPYITAIELLEDISTTYSPMGKIEVIRKTFAMIHKEIENHYVGVRHVLAMDDLFPLFQYIVIRARVPHLGSEIQFIEDLVDQSVLVGEAGHMVTTLSACYFQIQNERDRD